MKNTARHRFVARKIISKLTQRLEQEESPLYADWIISLMREGFKKQDAVNAFRKSSFVLLPDGSIATKASQRSPKTHSRVKSEKISESRESYSLKSISREVEAFDSYLAAHEKMVSQLKAEAINTKNQSNELQSKLRRIQNEDQ